MDNYKKALKFWDNFFINKEVGPVNEKFVDSDIFNKILTDNIYDDSKVLDYGCGSGWGLFEIYLTKKFKEGLGIDASANAILYANKMLEASNFNDKLKFINGTEEVLKDYQNYFNFILSVNTIDVVPDEVVSKILQALDFSLEKAGHLLICLNPNFTEQELIDVVHLEKKGNYYFKDEILRCNYKSITEWENLFKERFNLIKSEPFKLTTGEKYYRRLYLLEKKK